MESNVLYFPYIKVPKSTWFTRMLLYWDSVGTIVPYDFFENPDALGEHTKGLFERELVKPIPPGRYIYDIAAFDSAFGNFLGNPTINLELRRQLLEEGHVFKIHMEKMGPIEDLLVGLGLAKRTTYPWFKVECNTANEFMAYLAGCLGKVPEINSMPVTDEEDNLHVFLESEKDEKQTTDELNHLRIEVLEKVFPAPNHPLPAEDIENFKRKYGEKLRTFRRAVEKEIIELAQLGNPVHRRRRIEIFEDEIQELTDEINARFRENGIVNVVFGKLCPLLGAIPGASFVFGLANAVYNAFGGGETSKTESPLAYAAYAKADLFATDEIV